MYLVSTYGQGQSEFDNFMTNTTAVFNFIQIVPGHTMILIMMHLVEIIIFTL